MGGDNCKWFDDRKNRQNVLAPDRCKCSTCGTSFNVGDCETDHGHHDGWEMPAYTEILCSVCDDGGCIDDFWFSSEAGL